MKKSFILLFVIIFSCSVYSVGPRKSHNTQYTEDDAATIIGDVRGDLNGAWDSMIHQLRAAEQNTPNDRECKGNIFRQFVGNMMRIFREFTTAQPAFPAENLAALLLDPMFFKVENEVLQNIFQQFGLLRRFDYHQYISFLDFLMIFATEADREFFLSLLNDTLLSVHENCNTLNLIHPTSKTPPIVFFAIVWLEVLQVDGAQINTRGYSVIYPGLRLTLQMPLYRKKHYNSNEELYHENLSLLSIFIAQYFIF